MGLRLPKVGDDFFTQFESDYIPGQSKIVKIAEVDEERPIEDGDLEGRTVYVEEEGCWFDCFWSEKHGIFVYALQ